MDAAASCAIRMNGHVDVFYCLVDIVSKFCELAVAGVMCSSFGVEEDGKHCCTGAELGGEGWGSFLEI